MSFSIKINHGDRIIVYVHQGSITKEDIGAAWVELLALPEFSAGGYHLLSDYRQAEFQITPAEVHAISDYLAGIAEILNGKRQAILVHDPHDTAITYLFSAEVLQRIGFIVKAFSTEAAALHWLSRDNL
ncbi:MAG: hypothetical protein KDK39_15865 [Leptospiraceae bacterium]|nr:hypothetical protein [Leptospiraceae bacterium]